MTVANRALRLRSGFGLLVLGLLMAGGIAVGWFIVPRHARTFEWAYALFQPSCIAAICVRSLYHRVTHARWLVPLLLFGVMTNVVSRPHDALFTAIGVAAYVLAVLAALFGRNRIAIAGTLLCCCAITATLLTGLLAHRSTELRTEATRLDGSTRRRETSPRQRPRGGRESPLRRAQHVAFGAQRRG